MKKVFVLVYQGAWDMEDSVRVVGVYDTYDKAKTVLDHEYDQSYYEYLNRFCVDDDGDELEVSTSEKEASVALAGRWTEYHDQWIIEEKDVY